MEDKAQSSTAIEFLRSLVTDLPLPAWQIGAITIGALFALSVLTIFLYRRKNPDWRIRKKIKRLGPKHLVNLRIPDGMDGYMYIDYVVLTGTGLKLVSIKHFDGMIYGSESLDKWRQVTPSGSFEFPNPLKELEIKAKALKIILPEIDTDELVLFEGNNSFPKTMPENVKLLDEFDTGQSSFVINEKLQSSWQRVCEISV